MGEPVGRVNPLLDNRQISNENALSDWLAHCDSFLAIDMGLDVLRSGGCGRMDLAFSCPVVAVTAPMARARLAPCKVHPRQAGYRTERPFKIRTWLTLSIWELRGDIVLAADLVPALKLSVARGDISLTYFEFTLAVLQRSWPVPERW
jgi:hypothetical protein